MKKLIILLLFLPISCGFQLKIEINSKPNPHPNAKIIPLCKEGLINFDLVGTWKVFNYGNAKERFESIWRFDEAKSPFIHHWKCKNNSGDFYLSDEKSHVQCLIWRYNNIIKTLAVKKQSFGLLILKDVETGEQFIAIRTEGPQGDQAKYIKYELPLLKK